MFQIQGRSQTFGRGGGGKEGAIENIVLKFEKKIAKKNKKIFFEKFQVNFGRLIDKRVPKFLKFLSKFENFKNF